MGRTIVIIGGLDDDPDPDQLLRRLDDVSPEPVNWQWIHAHPWSCDVTDKAFNRFRDLYAKAAHSEDSFRVVKLFRLHNRDQHKLYKLCPDPVESPKTIISSDGLVEWIVSSGSGLFPSTVWMGNVVEAAFLALCEKMIGNKSWNKDSQGHNWTKHEDLLSQSPVNRPSFPEVLQEAKAVLSMLEGNVFLTKGSAHGKTAKGWSVSTEQINAIKRAITEKSLTGLLSTAAFGALKNRVDGGGDKTYVLDNEIISERTRVICQST